MMTLTRDQVMEKVREHLATELELDAGGDRRRDPVQGGPRRRLARPLRAGDGARGLLRGHVSRRGGGEDRDRRRRGRLRRSSACPRRRWRAGSAGSVGAAGAGARPDRAHGPRGAARAARRAAADAAPPGAHPLVLGRAPRRLLRPARLPRRQRPRAGDRRAPVQPLPARRHRPADEDARPGGQRPRLRRGRGRARGAGAARARPRPDRVEGGIEVEALLASRAGAGLGLRGGDRRLLPAPRLRGHRARRPWPRSRTRSSSPPSACSTSSRRSRSGWPARARA